MQNFHTTVKEATYLTGLLVKLTLNTPKGFSFTAGQYIEFDIGKEPRAYSIISAPFESTDSLSFLVALNPAGGLGTNFIQTLRQGVPVTFRGPFGFITTQGRSGPLYFIAHGIGVAPFISMISDLLHKGYQGPITLLLGIGSEEQNYFRQTYTHWVQTFFQFTFILVSSRPEPKFIGFRGRVTTYLKQATDLLPQATYFVSGSQDMKSEVRNLLLSAGIPSSNIQLEAFL